MAWQSTETWDELRERAKAALPVAEREFHANYRSDGEGRWFATGARADAAADMLAMCRALAEGCEPPVQALNAIPDNFAAWLASRGF